jgi:hypothetical protein
MGRAMRNILAPDSPNARGANSTDTGFPTANKIGIETDINSGRAAENCTTFPASERHTCSREMKALSGA